MIAYGVHITTQISDYIYDIGVKGQGQIYMYLKSVLRLVHFVTQTPLNNMLRLLVLISHNMSVVIYLVKYAYCRSCTVETMTFYGNTSKSKSDREIE